MGKIYVLYGEERYLIEQEREKIVRAETTKEEREFNYSTFNLEDTPVEEVVADAETLPFLGDRKLIVAENPVFLLAKPPKSEVEHDINRLLTYINDPAPYTTLVLIAPYEKVDERKKVMKELKKKAEVKSFSAIREWNMEEWVDKLAVELNLDLASGVKELVIQSAGTNLMIMRSELEKLGLYAENNYISTDIAEELLSSSLDTSGLKLVDAVINKDLGKAVSIYKELLRMNEEPIALIALLASQFRMIAQVKILKQKGYTENHMKNYIKAHPYVLKLAGQREKKFTQEKLDHILLTLARTDEYMKSGQMEKELAFEMMLYDIIAEHNRGALTP
ncbi:DNA polymerase III subunit delta [Salimicrobium jeotgali]|uniref:DNA polymerase III subunit delta n=1 Tax=Salimicrobium jeotgali TaxID=1230341 RepID=K2FMV5_9BACI|nr:DNA polymerase III subunit delta [Salimicrobium jeotgali]AKG04267.1 DNA polymerase III subunit delta [Salimicrobium jeotgali]EKE32236.1 DNA polymerase III subunit delta [Salimicrobium jeotgali]MBM7695847.1 DNA polymerase-3 subunit delta [Salimicrobium jeotgali]